MKYYQVVQPQQHHTTQPKKDENISVYSFALDPENPIQPSGSCNMSRIDNTELRILGQGVNSIHIWALNWNVFKVIAGTGGMMYTN